MFEVVHKYFEKNWILWQKCLKVHSDGAAAIVGKTKGVITTIKYVTLTITVFNIVMR